MSFATGVYGYTFTQAFDVAGLRFEPIYDRHAIAFERGRDTRAFHLTGVLLVPIDSLFALQAWTETFFDLEAALTFCEQQRVALSHCVQLKSGEDARTILLADEPNDVKTPSRWKSSLAICSHNEGRAQRREHVCSSMPLRKTCVHGFSHLL